MYYFFKTVNEGKHVRLRPLENQTTPNQQIINPDLNCQGSMVVRKAYPLGSIFASTLCELRYTGGQMPYYETGDKLYVVETTQQIKLEDTAPEDAQEQWLKYKIDIQETTLISANGRHYKRQIPKVVIMTFINNVALDNLRQQTGIDFKTNAWGNIEGQPKTWEQFAKIFLTYNWLTHDQNNRDGNVMYLRGDCNTPLNVPLYYEKDGKRFIGVDTKNNKDHNIK